MTPEALSSALQLGMQVRGLTVPQLAEAAGVVYETARRATLGKGGISLESTTKLLGAIGMKLVIRPIEEEATL